MEDTARDVLIRQLRSRNVRITREVAADVLKELGIDPEMPINQLRLRTNPTNG